MASSERDCVFSIPCNPQSQFHPLLHSWDGRLLCSGTSVSHLPQNTLVIIFTVFIGIHLERPSRGQLVPRGFADAPPISPKSSTTAPETSGSPGTLFSYLRAFCYVLQTECLVKLIPSLAVLMYEEHSVSRAIFPF
jgi:hypothetical protein